jgi:hypothetical protein
VDRRSAFQALDDLWDGQTWRDREQAIALMADLVVDGIIRCGYGRPPGLKAPFEDLHE